MRASHIRLAAVGAALCTLTHSQAEQPAARPPAFAAAVSCGSLSGAGFVALTVAGWTFTVPVVCNSTPA
jgi:hypothetical protein